MGSTSVSISSSLVSTATTARTRSSGQRSASSSTSSPWAHADRARRASSRCAWTRARGSRRTRARVCPPRCINSTVNIRERTCTARDEADLGIRIPSASHRIPTFFSTFASCVVCLQYLQSESVSCHTVSLVSVSSQSESGSVSWSESESSGVSGCLIKGRDLKNQPDDRSPLVSWSLALPLSRDDGGVRLF